ncbi:MAG: hypothetical protein U0166_00990 [Acidobacteriota bacterium]
MRQLSFQAVLAESVEGFGYDLDAFLWGRWHGDGGSDDVLDVSRPAGMGVVDRIRRRRSLAAEELAYLRARTGRVAKVALPSPSLWVNFWSGARRTCTDLGLLPRRRRGRDAGRGRRARRARRRGTSGSIAALHGDAGPGHAGVPERRAGRWSGGSTRASRWRTTPSCVPATG